MSTPLNIVVPVYNEGANFGATFSSLKKNIKVPFRLFVVYDFEEDDTLPVARSLQKDNPDITLVRNRRGKGVLNAIRSGFDAVASGVVLVIMADLSDDLSAVPAMIRKIDEGFDIVCGSRYMKGGAQIGGPLLKRTLSRLGGVTLHYLSGIPTRDVTNSFKMYRKSVLDSIEIESDGGFELGMEITVKAYLKGFRVTEIPSTWTDRVAGESRFQLRKWLPKYVRWYLYAVKGSLARGRKG